MKRIIVFLIIILFFSNCRYFNVSPVNGITIKNLTVKPLSKDFIGRWKIDEYSYELISREGSEFKNIELSINNDGSFEAKNFPNFVDVFSKKKRVSECKRNLASWKRF